MFFASPMKMQLSSHGSKKTLLRIWAPAPKRGAKLKQGGTKDGRKNPLFGASIPVRHVNSPLPTARLLIICGKHTYNDT